MAGASGGGYAEPGGSWRPFGTAAGVLGLVLAGDLALPGAGVPPLLWAAAAAVLGVVGIGCLAARRIWTVRVDADGLAVGRERIALRDVDAEALQEARAGVDAGAPLLGGGGSLPRGRTGLPLRLGDGRTVLVPTRDPAALRAALLAGVADASDRSPGARGTLGP